MSSSLSKEDIILTRDALVAKMSEVHQKAGYINCRLAVQLTVGFSKLEELEPITFDDVEIGDIVAWGQRHFALWLGHGDILQVGGWGESVSTESYREALQYWDQPTAFYRHPARTPALAPVEVPSGSVPALNEGKRCAGPSL